MLFTYFSPFYQRERINLCSLYKIFFIIKLTFKDGMPIEKVQNRFEEQKLLDCN